MSGSPAPETPTTPADAPDAPRGRRTALRMGAVLLGLVAVLFASGVLPRLARRELLAAQGRTSDQPVTVLVATPYLGEADNALTLPATLYGLHEASLYARASGYVSRVPAELGSTVRAGETLATVEMPEVEQELQQARASLEQGLASGALAKATLDRWQRMVEQKAATQQELDERRAAFDVSAASAKASRANVARLTALRRFGTITAPFSGVVTSRNVDVGALVSPGSATNVRPLFTIAQVDRLRVVTSVPQNAAGDVRVGQKADVLVQELGGAAFRGRVTRTSRALDYATRTLLVELELPNRDGRLMPGMFAQVKLAVPRASRLLLVPANTVLVRAEGPRVAVVRGGVVRIVPVSLGRDFGTALEVLGGVTVTDTLVVNPSDDVVDGRRVHAASPPRDSART